MRLKVLLKSIISYLLVFSLLVSLTGCSSAPPVAKLSSPEEVLEVESISREDEQRENIITEEAVAEFIQSEVYIEEIIVAEETISELLLEEESIEEILICKTIYIPENHLEDFAKNSQTAQLFGGNIDFKAVLSKFAIGTGIIITLVVLQKVGFPEPVVAVITGAAEGAAKGAATGAGIGTLFGGMTNSLNEVDETGRLAAVVGFSLAVVGLVLSIVSLVGAVPSGGSSSISLGAGVKIAVSGVSVAMASVATIKAATETVKIFTETDAKDIDWDNIDWNKIGYSAAEGAVEGMSSGYVWGAIFGALYGGADGLENYEKTCAHYSEYADRIKQTPVNGERGKWTGERGESDYVLKDPIRLDDGTEITTVTYKNGLPDFSPYQEAKVTIKEMTNSRSKNFNQADKKLAELWTKLKHNGQKKWTARDIKNYRKKNNLTWHEMNNMDYMQLVPSEVNQQFTHFGGVGEYNKMIGLEGDIEFD